MEETGMSEEVLQKVRFKIEEFNGIIKMCVMNDVLHYFIISVARQSHTSYSRKEKGERIFF